MYVPSHSSSGLSSTDLALFKQTKPTVRRYNTLQKPFKGCLHAAEDNKPLRGMVPTTTEARGGGVSGVGQQNDIGTKITNTKTLKQKTTHVHLRKQIPILKGWPAMI